MLPGPIFPVELVSAARRRRYFLLRVFYAAAILFVLWVTYESSIQWRRYSNEQGNPSIQQVADAAATFFVSFSWVQLIGLLAVAPAMAVGTIATERERRTIEYLFASDLSNAEIVLGKTLARLLLIGMFVLAGLPILFIFRLLGGIPAKLLAASFIISVSTAVFLTALSVCISVWSKKSRDATIRVYLALVVVLFLPMLFPIFGFMLGGIGGQVQSVIQAIAAHLMRINPVFALAEAIGGVNAVGARLDFAPVFEMLGWHAATSVAMIALATAAVRRVHLRDSTRGESKNDERGQRIKKTMPTLLRKRRPIGNHPMIWKELFAGASRTALGLVGILAVTVISVTIIGFTLYAFIQTTNNLSWRNQYFQYLMTLTGFAGPAALILVAARASGLVTQEKERDAWLSLLATPLSGAEIILGKAIGNLYAARWGLGLLAFAWALAIVFDSMFIYVFAVLTATFVILAAFVTMLGLFFSLRSKTSMRAMGLTLSTAIFVGGGYMFCCCSVLAVGGGLNGPDTGIMVGLAPCIPFLMGFPPVAFDAIQSDRMSFGDDFIELSIAYCIGVLGYFVAAGVLYANTVIEFDKLTDRTGERPDAPSPRHLPGSAPSLTSPSPGQP